MNLNVVFLSPRYLRYEYFGMLLQAIDIKKIFSFLPATSLPYSSAEAIRQYNYSEYNQAYETLDSYIEFINSIVDAILGNTLDSDELNAQNKGALLAPTILVLADWERSGNLPKHYNQYLEQAKVKFKRWSVFYDTFPFKNKYGDLTDNLISILKDKAGDNYYTHLIEHVVIRKLSVFFSGHPELVKTFDFRDNRWHCYTFKNRNTGKTNSYIQLWRKKTAHDNEDTLVYIDETGRKKMIPVTLEVMATDVSKWQQYRREEEERRWRAEYANDDDNDDDREQGCGNGWSCSNCPNVGCPANELN